MSVCSWKHSLVFSALLCIAGSDISQGYLSSGFQVDSASGRQWDKAGRGEGGRMQRGEVIIRVPRLARPRIYGRPSQNPLRPCTLHLEEAVK